MKNPYLISFAALVMFAASGCDRQSPDAARKIAELERNYNESAARQQDLEQQLEDQKLAAERDAIERERLQIEEDRAELERRQGDAAAAQDEAIRKREEALANREGRLEQFQSALEEKDDDLGRHQQQLSERDRELAGREALAFEPTELSEPVADYGMFYDSLSSYGSWFETPDYGYVWQPVVVRDSNWRPYSRGRWACSDRGWTWISEEPFGWATYHYGRWALLRGYGWIWVPGSEWAPSWVSWRENDSHIGWAPLPPETLAYRGHSWDSTVEVQFGIGALWFNFVEIRNFGSPIYRNCLPASRNVTFVQQTRNITHIHVRDRQVISGGPQYNRLSDRIGRPLPFYRIEVDQRARQSRDSLAMRSQVQGDRLVVSAPNIDAAWNDSLKPGRIKGRMESTKVERSESMAGELANRYQASRGESRRKAEQTVKELGGREKLDQLRVRRSQESRRVAGSPERPRPADPGKRESGRMEIPAVPDASKNPAPEPLVQQPDRGRERSGLPNAPSRPRENAQPVVLPNDEPARRPDAGNLQQDESRRVLQRQAEQVRDVQEEATKRSRGEQSLKMEQEKPREAEPAPSAQEEAAELSREEQAQQIQQKKLLEAEQVREAEKEAMKRGQVEEAQQQEKQREGEQAREVQEKAVKRGLKEQALKEQALKMQQEKQREAEQARDAEKEAMKRGQQEQAQQQEKQRETEQAREVEEEAVRRRQEEQALRMQQEKQREADKAREAQNEVMKQQQEQAQQGAQEQEQRQREQAQQRAQEQAQRRAQEQAQQRAQEQAQQRAQEQAQQRAQEQAQQRAQEQAQRQQEQARERQEQAREQEEPRQK